MSERWGALPLGELHPEDRCALCGYSVLNLKQTILASTKAWGMICIDVVACERRRYKAKNP